MWRPRIERCPGGSHIKKVWRFWLRHWVPSTARSTRQKKVSLLAIFLSRYARYRQTGQGFHEADLDQPIQRVCKYPLLFAELLKHTPVVYCPYSHMEIENALIRLREATAEINRATDDARIKSVLEKTWILQDRLVFPNQVGTGVEPATY